MLFKSAASSHILLGDYLHDGGYIETFVYHFVFIKYLRYLYKGGYYLYTELVSEKLNS